MNLGRLKIGLILLVTLLGFTISVQLALGKKKTNTPQPLRRWTSRNKQCTHSTG